MKKSGYIVLCILGLLSCGPRRAANDAEAEVISLRREIAAKDSIINDIFLSINVISQNLEAIKLREQIVTTNSSDEIGRELKAQINEDISAIDALLEENHATILRLRGSTEKLRSANIKIQEFEILVDNLSKQITDKDADIELMKNELGRLNFEVVRLTDTLGQLSSELTASGMLADKIIDEMTRRETEFNTVHYIVGQEKDLIDRGIVKKSGFIGRTLIMDDSYDLTPFTPVLRDNLDTVVVGHKKANIVTVHPKESYELIMSDRNTLESIRITDSSKFWESSKVLVVSYK
ncbi:MAG: hypothetical protein LIO79_01010 [Rikenellaceae bacterium]|nr:hypothetical protein [Rikenellaceae bacterium]